MIWPVMRRVLPDGARLTLEAEQEHQEINELLARRPSPPRRAGARREDGDGHGTRCAQASECHRVGAVSIEELLREAPARYVLGLTATPRRRDGHHPIVAMQCGPVRHTMVEPEPVDRRAVRRVAVERRTAFDPGTLPIDPGVQEVLCAIARDQARTALIVSDVVEYAGRLHRGHEDKHVPREVGSPGQQPGIVGRQWLETVQTVDDAGDEPAHGIGEADGRSPTEVLDPGLDLVLSTSHAASVGSTYPYRVRPAWPASSSCGTSPRVEASSSATAASST